jgi:hypothetical protein
MLAGCNYFFDRWKVVAKDEKPEVEDGDRKTPLYFLKTY